MKAKEQIMVERKKVADYLWENELSHGVLSSHVNALDYILEEMADIKLLSDLEDEAEGFGTDKFIYTGIVLEKQRQANHWWLLRMIVNDIEKLVDKLMKSDDAAHVWIRNGNKGANNE